MNKIFLSITLIFFISYSNAQDTIVTLSGDKLEAKVLEIGISNVKYKKTSNLEGPSYTISKIDIKKIEFENGEIELFSNSDKASNDEKKNISTSEKSEELSKIYFIRSTGFAGSMSAFTAFIDEELVCKLNNKRYSIHDLTPGEHTFTVQFAGKKAKKRAEPITIKVEAGKTYYIQMVFQTGAFKNNLYCQEVTENSANTVLVDCELDTKCL